MLSVARSVACLVSAVFTFYLPLEVGHDIRWAGSGSVMAVDWSDVQLWSGFAVVAGAVLGPLSATATRPGWRGAFAAAGLVGLLLGDAARRAVGWGGWDVAVVVDALLAVAVLISAAGHNRAPVRTAVLSVLAAGVGLALISVPTRSSSCSSRSSRGRRLDRFGAPGAGGQCAAPARRGAATASSAAPPRPAAGQR
ncbi:hypothetical protein [Modestobacter altitudinis]|uniref:hypothetical protein n=1 Tax=Modestobacter altitudinis TaxID=2213158 RepID=UPI00110D1CD9|nr:hypothetical protein [Modestobacter altitudinis]